MKRSSILSRINLSLFLVSLVFGIFVIVQIIMGLRVSESSNEVTQNDMPVALNTLAMLEELGDMNSNLLEYVLGEQEEKQEYFANLEEFERFHSFLPEGIRKDPDIIRLDRLVIGLRESAEKRVFSTYDPIAERKASKEIDRLIREVGTPLETLLDQMKEEEIEDVGSSDNAEDIIKDDLPGVRYYLELVDEAGDMLADLNRFVLGDSDSRRSFFNNALQFETFLASLKPLEQKPGEIVRIREIERLFNELKSGGQTVFDNYKASSRVDALKAIDDLEHQAFKESEELLDDLSSSSRARVEDSMNNLVSLSTQINILLIITVVGGIALLLTIVIYTRRSIFLPVLSISDTINRLREGDRDFDIHEVSRNDEIGDIVSSLRQFQIELAELDRLRKADLNIQSQLTEERDKLSSTLKDLKQTQDKLIATEKMASLGALVAGVAHEINTPIGVSVTISSHLKDKVEDFLTTIKTGELKQSYLDEFEHEALESLELLGTSLEKSGHLIQNFKQVATDQSSSVRRDFTVKEVLEEIISTIRHQIKGTKYTYRIEGPDDLLLDSYPGPFGQVITNLFNNSIIHGFDERDEGEINIRFSKYEGKLRLYFSDNGKGVSEENLIKLFDPFFTTRLGKGGSGLGLNIVHNIVTVVLGGEISVSSKIGTEFELILPLHAPEELTSNE